MSIGRNLAILLGCLLVSIGAIGGYYVGVSQEKVEMDRFCGDLTNGLAASIRGEWLGPSVAVLDAHTQAEIAEARANLVRQVRRQARMVEECRADPKCSALSMNPLPEKTMLQRALQVQ